MDEYKCHKKVLAGKITNIRKIYIDAYQLSIKGSDPLVVNQNYIDKHHPKIDGYFIQYKDGYQSFSPADAFESGYEKTPILILDDNQIMNYFKYDNLPEKLQSISGSLCDLALDINNELPDCVEKSVGLRKLLEAKDCFVRAAL